MSKVTPFEPIRHAPAESTIRPSPTLDELLGVERQAVAFATRYQGLPATYLPAGSSLVPATAERWRADALTARRRLPIRADVDRAHELVRAALRSKATPEVARMLVGQLLSCYPNDKVGNAQMAFEALVFDLVDTGHSDAVVAAACTRLRRTMKFRPAIAEVLEACMDRRRTFEGVGSLIGRLRRAMSEVHDVLHHSGGDPDPAEVVFHCELPGLEAEYAQGSSNRFWFDPLFNPALMFRVDPETGEETDAEWLGRVRALKAAADADPEGTALAIARAEGAEDGRVTAREYAGRSSLGAKLAGIERCHAKGRERYPNGEPRDLRQAWGVAAAAEFAATWDALLPNYDAQEQARGLRVEADWRAVMDRKRRVGLSR